jgi:nicotinate phosphoribosyltransferase
MNPTPLTDCYFTKSREALAANGHNPVVVWQIFQKQEDSVFCGLPFLEPMFEKCIEVWSLKEGDLVQPFEPAMIIKAHAQDFIEYETLYLGILARCGRIATNVNRSVTAACGKPVLFFPARFDVPETQVYDGYAAAVGGAAGCATETQMVGWNRFKGLTNKPVGTMPHALIAAFKGDTVAASLAFAAARPNEDVWVLVDFDNHCAATAVEVYKAFKEQGIESRLKGVRLDTSEKLMDAGIAADSNTKDQIFHGVCPELVWFVRKELNAAGAVDVKIAVSGGFTLDKIRQFEQELVPADVYAVGEGFLKGANAYTSDIVAYMDGNKLIPCAKVGRALQTTSRLSLVKGIAVGA